MNQAEQQFYDEWYEKLQKDLEIRLSMGSHRIDPANPGLAGLLGFTRADIDEQNRLYDAGILALKKLWGARGAGGSGRNSRLSTRGL